MTGDKEGMNDRSPMTSDNGASMQTSNKKRKSMDIHGDNGAYHHQESTNQLSNSHDNNNDNKTQSETDWEKLFCALQKERVTKAEALLYAYIRESEEREKLMRSYNQELENENQMLRSNAAKASENLQQQQQLQNRLEELQAHASQQSATIRAYQQLTGATLSNIRNDNAPKQIDNSNNDALSKSESTVDNEPAKDTAAGILDCVCTVQNPDTKISTKFRISTVESTVVGDQKQQVVDATGTILKFHPLENPEPLPGFLHEVIEFESSQLPPLLQNVLRGIFPEEEEEE